MSSKGKLPSILCFVDYYLPGFRSGGPVRTVSNLVDHLYDQFDFYIITRDRDISDSSYYEDIVVDNWNTVGKARVFYASPASLTPIGVSALLRKTPHDILYLNSFFSFRFTILPLLARSIGAAPNMPCVIAPRGEFSPAAIALSPQKKNYILAWCN